MRSLGLSTSMQPPPHLSKPTLKTHLNRLCTRLATVLLLRFLLTFWLVSPLFLSSTVGHTPIDLRRLLSADERPSSPVRKIAENGAYQPFDTIVVLQRARTDPLSPTTPRTTSSPPTSSTSQRYLCTASRHPQ